MAYDEKHARELLRREANLARWYDRAHAVRTHEHCGLGLEHIELVVARALERAYQDGRRDGGLDERGTALRGLLAQCEGIAASMRSREVELRKELDAHERAAPRTFDRQNYPKVIP